MAPGKGDDSAGYWIVSLAGNDRRRVYVARAGMKSVQTAAMGHTPGRRRPPGSADPRQLLPDRQRHVVGHRWSFRDGVGFDNQTLPETIDDHCTLSYTTSGDTTPRSASPEHHRCSRTFRDTRAAS